MEPILMQLAMENHLRQWHGRLPSCGYRTVHRPVETSAGSSLAGMAREHPTSLPHAARRSDPTAGRLPN